MESQTRVSCSVYDPSPQVRTLLGRPPRCSDRLRQQPVRPRRRLRDIHPGRSFWHGQVRSSRHACTMKLFQRTQQYNTSSTGIVRVNKRTQRHVRRATVTSSPAYPCAEKIRQGLKNKSKTYGEITIMIRTGLLCCTGFAHNGVHALRRTVDVVFVEVEVAVCCYQN